MVTEVSGKALISQSNFDLCFASNKAHGSGHVQGTGAPAVFSDPIFSPVASFEASRSSDKLHSYLLRRDSDVAAQETSARDFLLASQASLIGVLTPSQLISEEYVKVDPCYLAKTQALHLHYSHYRPVLGDGNCGWRAVAFSYFEKLIEPANHAMLRSEVARITSLNNLLKIAGFDEWLFEDMVEETTTLLKDLADLGETSPLDAKELLVARFNDVKSSNQIIYYLRLLVCSWLKANVDSYSDFIPDGLSVGEYIRTWIEPVNQEIDDLGIMLLIDILLKPIGFAVEIVYMDRSEGSQAKSHIFQSEDVNGVPTNPGGPAIYLLYRPSHYDILYKEFTRTPDRFINGVPQDVNIQVNRVGSFPEPRCLSFEGSGLRNTTQPSSLPCVDVNLLACIPGFQLLPQQSSNRSKLNVGRHFRPSKYEWDTVALRMDEPSTIWNSSEKMSRPSSPFLLFHTSTFRNSHYNTAHYNNPSFQPEEWEPDSEEEPRYKLNRCRNKSTHLPTSNRLSLQGNSVIPVSEIGQSLGNLQVSPKKHLGHEHKGPLAVSAKDTGGSEIHCEQSSTADNHTSRIAVTEQLDSSDADYESSDLGDFFKVFEAVQHLKIKGIVQDQKVHHATKPLSIMKQAVLDQGMQLFWSLFDQAWSAKLTGCATSNEKSPRTTKAPTTGTCEISAATLTNVTVLGKRFRNEDESEASGDDERSNGNKRNKSDPSSKSSLITSGFACPYRKHDTLQYSVGKWKICALTPQSTVARVKEHLYRYHRVHQCQRCKDLFKKEKELDAHIEATEGCESKPMKVVEGITAKMEKQLRCRKKAYRGQVDAERWKDIYKLLFPAENVPDPYFEPVQEYKGELSSLPSDSQDIAEYECYLRRELPRCFRRVLEAAINDDNDPIEEPLTNRIMDMYQDCQDLVLSSYRSTLETASIPIPVSVPEPTIELINQVAEYNLAAWNAGTSLEFDHLSNTNPDHLRLYDESATLRKGSTTMQSTKAANGNTLNDFNFGCAPTSLEICPQKLPSSTTVADWQIWDDVAVYPVKIDTVPLRHVDVSNGFEWADLLSLDP